MLARASSALARGAPRTAGRVARACLGQPADAQNRGLSHSSIDAGRHSAQRQDFSRAVSRLGRRQARSRTPADSNRRIRFARAGLPACPRTFLLCRRATTWARADHGVARGSVAARRARAGGLGHGNRARRRPRSRIVVSQRAVSIDVVFHVAGVAGIWGPWEHYYSINTLGTESVIAACRAAGVGRLIYTSSPSVTFDGTPQRGVDESGPYSQRWLCHYPHSKALAEQAVLAANGPGLATCALRPHLIWGPRDQHLVPRLLGSCSAPAGCAAWETGRIGSI